LDKALRAFGDSERLRLTAALDPSAGRHLLGRGVSYGSQWLYAVRERPLSLPMRMALGAEGIGRCGFATGASSTCIGTSAVLLEFFVKAGCHMSEQYNPASVKTSSSTNSTSSSEFPSVPFKSWKKAMVFSPFLASSTQSQMECWAKRTDVSSTELRARSARAKHSTKAKDERSPTRCLSRRKRLGGGGISAALKNSSTRCWSLISSSDKGSPSDTSSSDVARRCGEARPFPLDSVHSEGCKSSSAPA
jgi:hypothetical protein